MKTIKLRKSNVQSGVKYQVDSYDSSGMFINTDEFNNIEVFFVNKNIGLAYFVCNESDFVFEEAKQEEVKQKEESVSVNTMLKAMAIMNGYVKELEL